MVRGHIDAVFVRPVLAKDHGRSCVVVAVGQRLKLLVQLFDLHLWGV